FTDERVKFPRRKGEVSDRERVKSTSPEVVKEKYTRERMAAGSLARIGEKAKDQTADPSLPKSCLVEQCPLPRWAPSQSFCRHHALLYARDVIRQGSSQSEYPQALELVRLAEAEARGQG